MVSHKALVLVNGDENQYFPDKLDYCYLRHLYDSNSLGYRIFRKAVLKYGIVCFKKSILSNWLALIDIVDVVVLFDTGNAPYITRLLKQLKPKLRVIVWYWNSVSSSVDINTFDRNSVEFWSFDQADCQKYGMRYNTQFFIEENLANIEMQNNGSDVFYVGFDKDRSKILAELRDILKNSGISYNFNLVAYHNSTNPYGIEYRLPITYREVLQNIKSSKAVIDLVADWQEGLTLRPLEALFMKKKLITNMKRIQTYDFYNPNNIYILGVDDQDRLGEFIQSKYDESNNAEMKQNYSFRSWLERFMEINTEKNERG